MYQLLGTLGAAALGALVTLVVKVRLDRTDQSRAARRLFYIELMTLLAGRRRATERISYNPEADPPPDIEDDRLDEFDARLVIDASAQVRDLAGACFRTMNRFWASYTMKAPIDVDEHGLFHYRFDKMRELDPESAQLVLRMSLGELHDQLGTQMDALAERIRREMHGRS